MVRGLIGCFLLLSLSAVFPPLLYSQPIRSLPLDTTIPTADTAYIPIALISPVTTRKTTIGNIRSGLVPTSRVITCTAPLLCGGFSSTTLGVDFTLSLTTSAYQGTRTKVTTQFNATSNTTLANVTALSASLTTGQTYGFRAVVFTTSNVAGGIKLAIGGTATATTIIYEGLAISGGTIVAQARSSSIGSAVCAITAVTAARCDIEGTIIVNAGGTLTVQFAQNASNGTASSVLVGSRFYVDGPL